MTCSSGILYFISNNLDTFVEVLDDGEALFNNNHQNGSTESDTEHFVEIEIYVWVF